MAETHVSETTEAMPFRYRITNRDGGTVGVDVGDLFEKSDAYPNTADGYMQQIGLDMVRKGLGAGFMGLSNEEAELICLLAIKQADRG